MHRSNLALTVFALANAVGARFREQQRLVSGDVLKPRQVRAQFRLSMQVDVEGADVEEREIQEFRRRKVDVGQERVRRGVLRVLVDTAQEPFDAQPSVPAHDPGRNLVPQRDHQHGGVLTEFADPGHQLLPDLPFELSIIEERHVL